MKKRLNGKIAIIVGAGQIPGSTIGNGRAISILFAREGAQVMLVDRLLDRAFDTKKIIDEEGGSSFAFAADITRIDDCHRIAGKCVEVYGHIDILVNNVGIIGEGGLGELDKSDEWWDKIFDVNLKGLFHTCQYILPIMERQGYGSIVNISSAASINYGNMYAYTSSKAGVNALTRSFAMQYAGKGVRINAVLPGLINTPMAVGGLSETMGLSKESLIQLRDSKVPLKGGMGDAWDTAYATLFLASDEAKFITAVLIPVDGGRQFNLR